MQKLSVEEKFCFSGLVSQLDYFALRFTVCPKIIIKLR